VRRISCGLGAGGVVLVAVLGLVLPRTAAAQPATWNFAQAKVPGAQYLGNYGRGVTVAVIDTWVDYSQPQFGGRVVDEADCLSGSCVDHTYHPDECVHGTHVAGTIASAGYGVAPSASILSIQVLSGPAGSTNNPGASCSGSASSVAAGINFAVARGAKVINLSVADQVPGLFQSSAITDAVHSAAAHGVLVVFAAGNDDLPLTDNYGNSALVVGSTGPSGQLASYSNYNSPVTGDVNVAAPGGDTGATTACAASDCVLSTFPHNQLGLLEGTSMAAPHVAGLAALLWSQNPSRGLANVISTIESTATSLTGAGAGLINAQGALQVEAASHPPSGGAPPAGSGGGPSGTGGSGGGAGSVAGGSGSSGPGTGGSGTGVSGGVPAVGAGAPASTVAGKGPTVDTLPKLTTTLPGNAIGATTGTSGGPSSRTAIGVTPSAAKDWAGHHAGILIAASVLVAADVLALLWTREARRLFGPSSSA
jgi:subtilisin family serine protease